jgi:hypothetical protein
MKPTSKEAGERRNGERRTPSERRADVARAVAGDRRVVDNRGLGAAMVDALEDILQWERASERTLKVAEAVSSPDKLSN